MKRLFILFILLSSGININAKEKAESGNQDQKVSEIGFVMPRPSEVFSALDKTKISWQKTSYISKKTNFKSKQSNSFLLGLKISDGILAIFKKDRKKLASLEAEINHLSRSLMLEKKTRKFTALLRSQVKAKNWPAMIETLDKIYFEAAKELKAIGELSNATGAFLGGFFGASAHVSSLIINSKDESLADFLYDKGSVNHLIKTLEKLDLKKNFKGDKVLELEKALGSYKNILDQVDIKKGVLMNTAKSIHSLSAKTVKIINSGV